MVLSRVWKRHMEHECVGILEEASSCPCEGRVNRGALCPANVGLLRILGSKTLWSILPCFCRNCLRAGRQWDRLPRETVQSSSLDIFKTHLVKDLSNLFCSHN